MDRVTNFLEQMICNSDGAIASVVLGDYWWNKLMLENVIVAPWAGGNWTILGVPITRDRNDVFRIEPMGEDE